MCGRARSLLSPKAESKENPEDHSQVRMGHAPHLLAVLNNTALELLSRQGETNIARARRKFAYQFDKALHAQVS
jgi:hypothetical protein